MSDVEIRSGIEAILEFQRVAHHTDAEIAETLTLAIVDW